MKILPLKSRTRKKRDGIVEAVGPGSGYGPMAHGAGYAGPDHTYLFNVRDCNTQIAPNRHQQVTEK